MEGNSNLLWCVARFAQVVGEQLLFDIAVIAIRPIAKVAVFQVITEEVDDSLLGNAFGLNNIVHPISPYVIILLERALYQSNPACK